MGRKRKRQPTKEERFKEAYMKFQKSNLDTQALLEFIAVSSSVTSFGDGLSYSHLEKYMYEAMEEYVEKGLQEALALGYSMTEALKMLDMDEVASQEMYETIVDKIRSGKE